jgi:hypothetical protein
MTHACNLVRAMREMMTIMAAALGGVGLTGAVRASRTEAGLGPDQPELAVDQSVT